jgi:agmatine deiminase
VCVQTQQVHTTIKSRMATVAAPGPPAHGATPKSEGFQMPAEWEPHSKTWMAWPYSPKVWRSSPTTGEKPAQSAFVNIVRAIATFEPVFVGARCEELEFISDIFMDVPNVVVVPLNYNDSWLRDTGATFVVNRVTGESAGIDWKFNCWGEIGKSSDGSAGLPYEQDVTVAAQILSKEADVVSKSYQAEFVMEGGKLSNILPSS